MIAMLLLAFTQAFASSGKIADSRNAFPHLWAFPENESVRLDEIHIESILQNILDAENLSLKLQTHKNISLSRTSTRWQQQYFGIPVIGGGVTVVADENNHIRSLYQSLARFHTDFKPLFSLSSSEALTIAKQRIAPASLRGDITTEQVIFPQDGLPVACYLVKIPAQNPLGDWEVFVDASSGKILLLEDQLRHVSGVGMVFDPDPVTVLQDSTLIDDDNNAEAIPIEAYSEVELLDITFTEDEHYLLTGSYVDTEPTADRAILAEPVFSFLRDDLRFEEVMCYYHIDHTARYLAGLGLNAFIPAPLLVNVNGTEADMSFFSPHTGMLTTGTGGVDDAEDADVIIHEYGHAVMDQILGIWRGGETALLSEGWCDYLAGQYSQHVAADFGSNRVFNWDGNGEFWDGRILNADYTYPEIEDMEPHQAGQLWSSLLMEILRRSGNRDDWNRVIVEHLTVIGDSATVTDAAAALLITDLDITNGAFRSLIVQGCERREIFPAGVFSPNISHRSLKDTENLEDPRIVTASIASDIPLDSERVWLIYAFEEQMPDTVLMANHGNENIYEGEIPAPRRETDVGYYLVSADTLGVFSTYPQGAPLVGCRYHAGADFTPPALVNLSELPNTVFRLGESNISVDAQDNLGMESVIVLLYDSAVDFVDSLALEQAADSDQWRGKLDWDMNDGQEMFYRVLLTDAAENRNSSLSRLYSFARQNEAYIDIFEADSPRWLLTGWNRLGEAGRLNSGGLADRLPDDASHVESVAMLDENWNFTQFGRVRVLFWEKHPLSPDGGETAEVDLSLDGGESWANLIRFRNSQDWWVRREINLDEYALANEQQVRLRWRTTTAEGVEPGAGWFIDDIFISVHNIVSASESEAELPSNVALICFPNPANSSINIQYSASGSMSITLLSLDGRRIMQLPVVLGEGVKSLSVEHLPSGRYFIEMRGQNQRRVLPFTVQK